MLQGLHRWLVIALLSMGVASCGDPKSDADYIVLQSGTTLESSGLLQAILPKFTDATGIDVRVVSTGTGHALKNAMNGDGDVVLTHSRADEEAFVAQGFGVKRHDVMRNDFLVVGPDSDPASIKGLTRAADAFKRIAESQAAFASRADNSGTHKTERAIWRAAGVDAARASGQWYLETGSSMGATLTTALGRGAYALVDRGTWLAYRNKDGLVAFVEGDPGLINQYGAVLVSAARHPHIKAEMGQAFIDWLTGPEGQSAIAQFKIGDQQPFMPNAPAPDTAHANIPEQAHPN